MAKKKQDPKNDPKEAKKKPAARKPKPAPTSSQQEPAKPISAPVTTTPISAQATTTPEVKRNPDGTFAKGHAQIGHTYKGQKHKLSQQAQLSIMAAVAEEVESDRFKNGLTQLYFDDRKGYYQIVTGLAKFAAPTLSNDTIEITDETKERTLDDYLDELMNLNKK